MFDELEQQFLDSVFQIQEQETEKAINEIEGQLLLQREAIAESFCDCLLALYQTYARLQEEKKTNSVKYLYISFLRSSAINGMPWYRLDFYDERGRASLTECAVIWDFTILSEAFEKIIGTLTDLFEKQNRVNIYRLEEMKLKTAESLNRNAHGLFVLLMQSVFALNAELETLFKKGDGPIFLGEFMDHAEELLFKEV